MSRNWIAFSILVFLGILAILVSMPTPGVRLPIAEQLAPRRAACAERVAILRQARVLLAVETGSLATTAEVDRQWWDSLGAEGRTETALIFYCAWMPESGRMTLVLADRSGKKLGQMADGNWFPAS